MALAELRDTPAPRETINQIKFRLPDGQQVLLSLQEDYVLSLLPEETAITRVEWARRVYPDPKMVVLSVATETTGKYRGGINKKIGTVGWEAEEVLPAFYRYGLSKNEAKYRLHRKQPDEDTIRVVRIPGEPDKARIFYTTEPTNSSGGTEVVFIHKPYTLPDGTQIRYLTETGWQLMNAVAGTITEENASVEKTAVIEQVNAGREVPLDDLDLQREITLFEQTITQANLALVNDAEFDRQGYVISSRLRIIRIPLTNTDELPPPADYQEYEIFRRSDHNDNGITITPTDEPKTEPLNGKPKNIRRSRYALVLDQVLPEQRLILDNIPYIAHEQIGRLHNLLDRDTLQRIAHTLPQTLDGANDAKAYPRGMTVRDTEDLIRIATFVAAFTENRLQGYVYNQPVSAAMLKRDLQTCLSGPLSRYIQRELTDIFEAMVIQAHRQIVPQEVYRDNPLVDLYFSSIQTEEERAFADQFAINYTQVFRFCYFKTQDLEEAADITQRVFLNSWNARGKYSPDATYQHFLITVARNAVVDRFREKNATQKSTVGSLDNTPEEVIMHGRRIDLPDPVARYAEIQVMMDIVNQLEMEERKLLYLRYWENKEFGPLSDELGISAQAARARHVRLLRRLRVEMTAKLLDEFIEGERIVYRSQSPIEALQSINPDSIGVDKL